MASNSSLPDDIFGCVKWLNLFQGLPYSLEKSFQQLVTDLE